MGEGEEGGEGVGDINDGMISVVTMEKPIYMLYRELIQLNPKGCDGVKTQTYENSISCIIVLAIIVTAESLINRLRYHKAKRDGIKKEDIDQYIRKTNTLKFYRSFCQCEGFTTGLEELFSVRNAIAHNHIWEVNFRDNESGLTLTDHKLIAGGNERFLNKILNRQSGTTNRFQFSCIPTMIDYRDALKAIRIGSDALFRLDKVESDHSSPMRHNLRDTIVSYRPPPVLYRVFYEEIVSKTNAEFGDSFFDYCVA